MAGRGHRDIFASDAVWARGSSPGISFARFMLDENDQSAPLVLITRFEPSVTIQPHTHQTNYFEYVIVGEQTVGKIRFAKGDVRLVKAGVGYGPIKIGLDGCTVLIVFQQANGAAAQPLGRLQWPDEREPK